MPVPVPDPFEAYLTLVAINRGRSSWLERSPHHHHDDAYFCSVCDARVITADPFDQRECLEAIDAHLEKHWREITDAQRAAIAAGEIELAIELLPPVEAR
jgi:hypothetical protein